MTGQVDDRLGAIHDRLVEAMNSGVLATDEHGRITAWNPRAGELLGYTRDEVLGRPMHRLLHRDADGRVPPERDCVSCAACAPAFPITGTASVSPTGTGG